MHWLNRKSAGRNRMDDFNRHLLDLFADHGVILTPDAGWLTTNHTFPKCRAVASEPELYGSKHRIHVAVEVAINSEQTIVERFLGWGTTAHDALHFAMARFALGVFHVLLSALWHIDHPEQYEKETLICGSEPRDVLFGPSCPLIPVGGVSPAPPQDLAPAFDNLLSNTRLDGRFHWTSFFYGCGGSNDPNPVIVEACLDNVLWVAGESLCYRLAWPKLDTFYSMRWFTLMLPIDGVDGLAPPPLSSAVGQAHDDDMKIQAGIRTLLDIVVATPAAEDYQIVETLLRRGLSELDAERLIAFVPMACGRAVLEAEGVHYPETFLARDESGREARGRLIDEPVFRAGQAFVKQHGISSVAVRRLAERSAEVNAFRAMRSQGADLKIGEAVLLRLPVDAVHSRSW